MARLIELENQKQCASWGYQGESGATILIASISEFVTQYPTGKPNVIFQRHDGHPYMHKFILSGENLLIELNSTDTQQQGKCEVQISWIVSGNKVMKKKIYSSYILPGDLEGDLPLTDESILALDNLEAYVEEAKLLLNEAKQYAAELVFVEALPEVGDNTKLYIDKATSSMYYWSGDAFMLLNPSYECDCDDKKPSPPPPPRPPHNSCPPITGDGQEILYGGNAFFPQAED